MNSFRRRETVKTLPSKHLKPQICLIKCLIECAYEINDTWASFHNDVTKIKEIFFDYFCLTKLHYNLDKVHSISNQSNLASPKPRFSIHWKIVRASSQNVVKNVYIVLQRCRF